MLPWPRSDTISDTCLDTGEPAPVCSVIFKSSRILTGSAGASACLAAAGAWGVAVACARVAGVVPPTVKSVAASSGRIQLAGFYPGYKGMYYYALSDIGTEGVQ